MSRAGPTPRLVYGLLAAYLLLHLAYRCLFPSTLNLDEAEQVLLTQRLQWGYNAQPPLYTWLQILLFRVFGVNVLALGALKLCLLFLFHATVFSLARRLFLDDAWAAAALASLFLSPEISWGTAGALTHTILLLLACALTWRVELTLAERRSAWGYVSLGLCIALGCYAKYTFPALMVALGAGMLAIPSHRRVLLDLRMLLAAGIALLLLAPHALWLKDLAARDLGGDLTHKIAAAQESSLLVASLRSVGDLLSDILYSVGFPLLGIAAAFRRRLLAPLPVTQPGEAAWIRLFRASALAAILLLVVLAVLFRGTGIRARWVFPFFLMLPLAMLLRLRRAEGADSARRILVGISLTLALGASLTYALRPVVGPALGDRPRFNAAFDEVARSLRALGFRDGILVADHDFLAGSLRLNLPECSAYAPGLGFRDLPDLRGKRILLVWPPGREGRPPDRIVRLLEGAGVAWPESPPTRIDVPDHRSGKDRTILDVILYEVPR